jgi:hypothetical protein
MILAEPREITAQRPALLPRTSVLNKRIPDAEGSIENKKAAVSYSVKSEFINL